MSSCDGFPLNASETSLVADVTNVVGWHPVVPPALINATALSVM